MASGDAAAAALQEEKAALPPVAKSGPKDPWNSAKRAVAAARPANAPAGSAKCPYCECWLPPYHQENCPRMPFDLWVGATRTRNELRYGRAVVDGWTVQCQHCATPFPSPASKRVHLSGCERRRNEAGLPLNQYPALRR